MVLQLVTDEGHQQHVVVEEAAGAAALRCGTVLRLFALCLPKVKSVSGLPAVRLPQLPKQEFAGLVARQVILVIW